MITINGLCGVLRSTFQSSHKFGLNHLVIRAELGGGSG